MADLKAEWERRLTSSGFEDIETKNGSLKVWHSFRFQYRHTPETFSIRQDYFSSARRFLNLKVFDSKTDRHIWELHSEGYTFRGIAKELKARFGVRTNKDSVYVTVARLKEEMLSSIDKEEKEVCPKKRRKVKIPVQLSLFENLI